MTEPTDDQSTPLADAHDKIDSMFYEPPTNDPKAREHVSAIRFAAKRLAMAIIQGTPKGEEQDTVIRVIEHTVGLATILAIESTNQKQD